MARLPDRVLYEIIDGTWNIPLSTVVGINGRLKIKYQFTILNDDMNVIESWENILDRLKIKYVILQAYKQNLESSIDSHKVKRTFGYIIMSERTKLF
jgi:hypothetical protein